MKPSADPATLYGHFDDSAGEFVVTDPLTPEPWINYIGNTRLSAFVSQQAGGLAWHIEPQERRLTRYFPLPSPGDRPGFYLYVRDEGDGVVWNPHHAPTGTPLDAYECRNGAGYTRFMGERAGVRVGLRLFVPPGDDVMVWDVTVENVGKAAKKLTLASYVEFGILEYARELYWAYLKKHIAFDFEPARNWIRYDYHVFEAPFTPKIFFTCTRPVDGFDCSRDAFCGRGGSLERPAIPLSGSQLPGGGHGVGSLGLRLDIPPGGSERFAFLLGVADDWDAAARLKDRIDPDAAFRALEAYWKGKTGACRLAGADPHLDRAVSRWMPVNCQITLERCRDLSTDHPGTDSVRYRDTMQDALAVAHFDPAFAAERIKMIFASQARDGQGNFSFFPFAKKPRVNVEPERSDNTVWPLFTVDGWLNETGNLSFLDESIPFRDGGEASVYEHMKLGLRYIDDRLGPHGLPMLAHADWNDGLAVFFDPRAESVMLGMQMALGMSRFADFARRLGRDSDAKWADAAAARYRDACNADGVWDGEWYARLLFSDGSRLGVRDRPQGRIYLEPQVWAVLSGVGDRDGRGRRAMESARAELGTAHGLCICNPPFTGIPTPDDPMIGSAPGTGENGAIFCHANSWAVIAWAMLGEGDEAWSAFRKILPSALVEEVGQEHYGREPYVFNSTILAPAQGADFGKGGISWLTGTASWMYVAATQYLLGVKPELDGLRIAPCLPAAWDGIRVSRRFRGKDFDIRYRRAGKGNSVALTLNGSAVSGDRIPLDRCGERNEVTVTLGGA